MNAPAPDRVVYPPAPAAALRTLGAGALLLGLALVAWVLARSAGLDRGDAAYGPALVLLALCALPGLALFATGAWRALRPGPLLVLDDRGFELRTAPFGGVRRGSWTEVRAVRTMVRGRRHAVVLDLTGRRPCVIDASLLGVPGTDLAAAVRRRLSRPR